MEIGRDETAGSGSSPGRRYLWLYEWDAWREVRRQPIDVIHILYAEEYFRFMKMQRLLDADAAADMVA